MCGEAAAVRIVSRCRRDRLQPPEETLLDLFVFAEVLPEDLARSGCGVLKLREDRHEERRIRPLRLGHVAADLRNASSQHEELRDDLREVESLAEPGREVGFEEFAPLLLCACIVISKRR